MRKTIVILVILCFAFSVMFIACGKKEEPAPPPKPAPKAPVMEKPAPTPPLAVKPDTDSDVGGIKPKKDAPKATGLKKK